jgi:Na+/H+ antiporter NhaD/arsenite permease-like protein
MEAILPVLALLSLLAAIALGFWTGVHLGIISVTFAFVVGYFFVGMSPEEIYLSGWPINLFFMLTGMTLLFGIAKINGAFAVLAKQISSFSFGSRKLMCLIMYLFSAVVAMAGVGTIVTPAVLMPLILEIAKEEDIPEPLAILLCIAGSIGGGLSPIAPTGVIGIGLGQAVGLESFTPIFIMALFIFSIHGVLYFFAFGGWKLKKKPPVPRPPFVLDRSQRYTLVVLGAVIFCVLFLKFDLGLSAFLGAGILMVLGAADAEEAIKNVSWSTLLLICGVSVLVNVVKVSGGIDLTASYLGEIMSAHSAPAVLNLLGGLMSMVSSASGVVMPTLIPTIPGIVAKLGNDALVTQLVAGITIGAHVVPYSPLSTMGAIGMAAATERSNKEKLFVQLMASALSMLAFTTLLIWFGFFDLFF